MEHHQICLTNGVKLRSQSISYRASLLKAHSYRPRRPKRAPFSRASDPQTQRHHIRPEEMRKRVATADLSFRVRRLIVTGGPLTFGPASMAHRSAKAVRRQYTNDRTGRVWISSPLPPPRRDIRRTKSYIPVSCHLPQRPHLQSRMAAPAPAYDSNTPSWLRL